MLLTPFFFLIKAPSIPIIANNKSSTTPVKIDICAGSGEWALAQAKNDPDSLWITLELKSDRVYDTFWGMAMQKQNNMLAIQGNADDVVENCIPSNFVDYIYVNHPEPPERTGGTDDSDGEHLLTHVFFWYIIRMRFCERIIAVPGCMN